MPPADVVILPVVRVAHVEGEEAPAGAVAATVTDINGFRYRRERADLERRAATSLLPDEPDNAP